MGLLDGILGGATTGDLGGLPEDEWKKAALEDMLARLAQAPMKGVNPGVVTQVNSEAKGDKMPMGGVERFAAPMLLGGPKTVNVGEVGDPTPEQRGLPPLEQRDVKPIPVAGVPYTSPEAVVQTDRPQAAPRATVPVAKPRNAPDAEPNIWDHIGALSRGYDKGGLLGGIADMANVGRDKAIQNQTTAWLTQKLGDPGLAQMVARDPATLRALIPILAGPKSAPTIVEIPGQYGQSTKMVWNPQSGKLEPLSSITGGEQPAAGQVIAPIAGNEPVKPDTKAALPVVPGVNIDKPDATAQPVVADAKPDPTKTLPPGYRKGNAVPKPPEGFIHKAAPDGTGFLYDERGQPVFESKAEADARAKGTEKRALEAVDQQNQTQGVKDVVGQARKVVEMPGFNSALFAGRMSFNAGIPTPWGMVGGDLAALPKSIARAALPHLDPGNPMFPVYDEIQAVQERLSLLVARPLMKGQGAVTDGEREMIKTAIGKLSSAADAADYQFKLNSIERMIEAMNSGRNGSVTAASNAPTRPSEAEIAGSFYDDPKYGLKFKDGAVANLAKKYGLREADMQQYLNLQIMRSK